MVVRMRKNRSKTRMGRSHEGVKAPVMATCKHCGAHHRPHHMCLECGFYNGRQVLNLEAEKEKRDARLKAKREAIAGADDGSETEGAPKNTSPEPQAVEAPTGEATPNTAPAKDATSQRDK